jgi:hypothetical protein
MKARFVLRMENYPVVEIIPHNSEFKSLDGRVAVHFLKIEESSGKLYLDPRIHINASFGSGMFVHQAEEWAEIISAAVSVANKKRPPQEIEQAFSEAWGWLELWKAKHPA